MINFPEWSDLGGVSDELQDLWHYRWEQRQEYRRYFSGDIFKEKVPLEAGTDDDAPLLYPVGINLVRMLAIAQADALFGEWEDSIVRFIIRHDEQEDLAGEAAIKLCQAILEKNHGSEQLWEGGLHMNVYGGTAFEISVDLGIGWPYIKFDRLHLDNFLPIWNPDDPNELLKVYLLDRISTEQAELLYPGKLPSTGKGYVERLKVWTKKNYEFYLDGKKIGAFSGINPYGVVPFVYIPRLRTHSWYGEAITPELIPAQDELNMRIADIGDAINYNAHPIRYGINLPRNFDANNFPLGPQAMWDLGRTIGNSPDPQVGLLEPKNPVPERALDFVNFVYDWSRTSAFAPPIAFGEDQGGGQRSGRTLEIRMWPLLRATRRSRSYMGAGIAQMMRIAARMLWQKKLGDVSQHALTRIMNGTVKPDFFPIMPKDRQALLDEVVKLISLDPPQISMETVQQILSRGPSEVDRIEAMLDHPVFGEFFKNRMSAAEKEGAENEEKEPEDKGSDEEVSDTGSQEA